MIARSTQLYNAYDAPIELEPEGRQGDRLHIADDLLRSFAGQRDDVDLGDSAPAVGDDPGDRHIGETADLPLHIGQVEVIHAQRGRRGGGPRRHGEIDVLPGRELLEYRVGQVVVHVSQSSPA